MVATPYQQNQTEEEAIDEVEGWLLKLGRKVEVEDVHVNVNTNFVAERYARTYTGTFAYMQEMCDIMHDPRKGFLTNGQVKGVLNCLRAELMRTARTNPDPVTRVVRDGYYTIVHEDGSHITVRVRTARNPGKYNMPEGTQFISYLYGPDNTSDYTSFGMIMGEQYRPRAEYRETESLKVAAETLIHGDRDKFGKTFAMESGNCYICNKLLTDPVSIERGIGPKCWDNLGN
jgi:hypothetical protein